jgi:hypothetical protein
VSRRDCGSALPTTSGEGFGVLVTGVLRLITSVISGPGV